MLVLTRKLDESIVINDNITIAVVDIHGDKVRLGIEAPKDIPVYRKEVYDAIHGTTHPPHKNAGKVNNVNKINKVKVVLR